MKELAMVKTEQSKMDCRFHGNDGYELIWRQHSCISHPAITNNNTGDYLLYLL